MVEPIKMTSKEYRLSALKNAFYNPFQLKAEDILIDLLTDSGLSAMSSYQWARMMESQDAYMGSSSFSKFVNTATHVTGFQEIIPTQQGRSAERILFQGLELRKHHIVISNGFFDTTKCALDCIGCTTLEYPEVRTEANKTSKFMGNMKVEKFRSFLQGPEQYRVSLCIMCITNSHFNGFPVSLENVAQISELCKQYKICFILDACRFAENIYFNKRYEPACFEKSLIEICREMFSYADGCYISMKKDGLCNTGGFLALKSFDLAQKCRENIILNEGFPNYGGLTGRDLEAMAQGLLESISDDLLSYHFNLVEDFGALLDRLNLPVILPTTGYSVFVNASDIFPAINRSEHPAWSLVCALYVEGGIRACEIGSVMQVPGDYNRPQLIRFSIPRRVYTASHIQHVADTLKYIADNRDRFGGYEIIEESDILRHFTIKLRPKTPYILTTSKNSSKTWNEIKLNNSLTKRNSSNLETKGIDINIDKKTLILT